jgi:hypothetical protein
MAPPWTWRSMSSALTVGTFSRPVAAPLPHRSPRTVACPWMPLRPARSHRVCQDQPLSVAPPANHLVLISARHVGHRPNSLIVENLLSRQLPQRLSPPQVISLTHSASLPGGCDSYKTRGSLPPSQHAPAPHLGITITERFFSFVWPASICRYRPSFCALFQD